MDADSTRAVSRSEDSGRLRTANRRTAAILLSVAAVFFAGIIATRWVGGGTIGIGVMGTAVLLFLVIAIGRNLRRSGERAGGSDGPENASPRADAQRRDASAASGEVRR